MPLPTLTYPKAFAEKVSNLNAHFFQADKSDFSILSGLDQLFCKSTLGDNIVMICYPSSE